MKSQELRLKCHAFLQCLSDDCDGVILEHSDNGDIDALRAHGAVTTGTHIDTEEEEPNTKLGTVAGLLWTIAGLLGATAGRRFSGTNSIPSAATEVKRMAILSKRRAVARLMET